MIASTRTKPDAVLVEAVETARDALVGEVARADVGEHLGHDVEDERVVSHYFACTRAGYRGWRWSVTLTRASRQRSVTVDEVVLIPGEGAITAPAWVPYKERVRPGDLSPGDLLPVDDDDPRLVPTYSFGDDDSVDPFGEQDRAQVREVVDELFLGRVRTLSPEGRAMAAQRWYDGPGGVDASIAQSAPASCFSCGFLVRLTGTFADSFGVCANGNANDDGRVVAFGHGCGAHSEAQLSKKQQPVPPPDHVFDTLTMDDIEAF